MKRKLAFTSVLSAFTLLGVADAQSGSGTMGVTATVQGSINLTFVSDASGLPVTGTNTNVASLPLGPVQLYGGGTPPANVTKTVNGVTSFALATPFDVRVDLANSVSTTYTLAATLSTADAINTWLLGAINISSGTSTTLTAAGAYATAVPYTLNLTVPASAGPGLITMTFTATGT